MAKNLSRPEVEEALAEAKQEEEEDNLPNPLDLERIAKDIARDLLAIFSPFQPDSHWEFPLRFVLIIGDLAKWLITKDRDREIRPTKIQLLCLLETETDRGQYDDFVSKWLMDLLSQYPDYDIDLTVATDGIQDNPTFEETYPYFLWFDPEKGFFVPGKPEYNEAESEDDHDWYYEQHFAEVDAILERWTNEALEPLVEEGFYPWVDEEHERWAKREEREQINYRVMVECELDYYDENLKITKESEEGRPPLSGIPEIDFDSVDFEAYLEDRDRL